MLPPPLLLDFMAVRVDPEKIPPKPFKVNLELTDRKEHHLISIQNGVMIHEKGISDPEAGATVKCNYQDLLLTLIVKIPISLKTAKGDIVIDGDKRLFKVLAYHHRWIIIFRL